MPKRKSLNLINETEFLRGHGSIGKAQKSLQIYIAIEPPSKAKYN